MPSKTLTSRASSRSNKQVAHATIFSRDMSKGLTIYSDRAVPVSHGNRAHFHHSSACWRKKVDNRLTFHYATILKLHADQVDTTFPILPVAGPTTCHGPSFEAGWGELAFPICSVVSARAQCPSYSCGNAFRQNTPRRGRVGVLQYPIDSSFSLSHHIFDRAAKLLELLHERGIGHSPPPPPNPSPHKDN